MSININLGNWSSVFAVPSVIVDKHIKLAGSAQLKVLLWILRHAGEDFSAENISAALNMHPADVTDAMQYWIETGLLAENNNSLTPVASDEIKPDGNKSDINGSTYDSKKGYGEVNPESAPDENKKIMRQVSRPQKPDSKFVAQRINSDPEIAALMQEAEIIFGRPISSGDSATLLLMHDNDGLPTDVIIMLLQYATGEKKGMRYIEKMAIDWANDGIDSIEAAERKIRSINQSNKAWNAVKDIFGLQTIGSPSKNQIECANRWINEWKLPLDVIREAYERCIDSKGEYKLNYIDAIIKRWYANGITTIEQVHQDVKMSAGKRKESDGSHSPSYSIDEYEKNSIFD